MTLSSILNSQFTFAQNADFFFRILIACACGFILGVERSKRFKEAGARTHMIVCSGAALVMIVSKYGFGDLIVEGGKGLFGTTGTDPARLAAQVITGISFLGAGMIFKNGSSIKGLTTAAGIWATAGIGLAIGAGMYFVGVLCTVIIALIQVLMHIVTVGSDSYRSSNLEFLVENNEDFHGVFNKLVKDIKAQVIECRITREGELLRYNVTLKIKKDITTDDITNFLSTHPDVKEVSVITL